MKTILLSAAALAAALTAAPAMAQGYVPPAGDPVEYQSDEYPYTDDDGSYEAAPVADGSYEPAPDYVETSSYAPGPRRIQPGDYVDPAAIDGGYYRPGRERCRGTTGAVIGGIAGALIGAGDGHSHRRGRYRYRHGGSTVGALVGGGLGALIGSEIDKDACRRSR